MTKKDYEMIARVIKGNREYSLMTKPQIKAIDNLAFDLSHVLHLENVRFDSKRFLAACGSEQK